MTTTMIAVAIALAAVGVLAMVRGHKPPRVMTDEEKVEQRIQAARARAIQRVNDGHPYEPSRGHWWM